MVIWSILLPIRILLAVYFVVILVYFPLFGMLQLEKSGNPGEEEEEEKNCLQSSANENKELNQIRINSWAARHFV
jgi:Tfp pilus assembly protein PilO